MKKTPLVFVYDYEKDCITREVKPGSEWVFTEDAVATLKIDGSACLFDNNILYKRYDRRLLDKYVGRFAAGDQPDLSCFRTPPEGFIPCEESYDSKTFHWPGWVPVDSNDKFHIEALNAAKQPLVNGQTYELVGPKFGNNAYALKTHELWAHGEKKLDLGDITFENIQKFLTDNYVEGIVFHNKKDGRVAKIRRKDFNLFWQKEDLRKTFKRKKTRLKL